MVSGQPADLHFERFGIEDGLSNQSIQSLYQDKEGYLWIGTWDGLNRYNGYEFQAYYFDAQDSSSLIYGDIKATAEDGQGRLWVTASKGLCYWDRITDQFVRWDAFPGTAKRDGGSGLLPDHEGNLWISPGDFSTVLAFWDAQADSFKRIKAHKNRSRAMLLDKAGLWLAYSDQWKFYSFADSSFYSLAEVYPVLGQIQGGGWSVLRDHTGIIWMGTHQGLYAFNPETASLRHFGMQSGLLHPVVLSLAEDKQGLLWVGTPLGLHCLSADRSTWGAYQHDPGDAGSLSDNIVTKLLVDRSDNLWIGTYRGGLNKVQLQQKPNFVAYDAAYFGYEQYEFTVFAFAEGAQNRLWLGTTKGLFLLDKSSKNILRHYQYGDADTLGLSFPGVMSLYETTDEKLLIGMGGGTALCLLDIRAKTMQHLQTKTSQYAPENFIPARDIVPVPNEADAYWILGSYRGRLNLQTGSFIIDPVLQDTTGLRIGYLYEGRSIDSCTYYFANGGGLSRFNLCLEQWQHLRLPIRERTVLSFYTDGEGHIYQGTYGNGVFKTDLDGNILKRYKAPQHLPNGYIYAILKDADGMLWMSSNAGIIKFHPRTEVVTVFTPDDGLQDFEFATGASLTTKEGEMLFGGINGFTAFFPDQIVDQASDFVPPIHLSSVILSGDTIPFRSGLSDQAAISFPAYRGQYLEISFAALDFTQPKKIRYQYRLDGWDDTWTQPQYNRKVQFHDLPPGTYTFRVRGSNHDGIFFDREARLLIEVKPLWHQLNEVRWGLPLLFLILMAWGIYRWLNYLRRQERNRLHHRIAEVRQEALASQMDQHFTFNALNSIQRFISQNDTKSAILYISRFGKLVRRVLNQARQNFHSLQDEIETLDLYLSLEKLRTKAKFNYQIEVDPSLDPYQVELPVGLLQPFVENAIWHGLMPKAGTDGHLRLMFEYVPDGIRLLVEDNGIGREEARRLKQASKLKHQSKGTLIVQERIDTLNQLYDEEIVLHIEDLAEPNGARGTRVSLFLPLSRS